MKSGSEEEVGERLEADIKWTLSYNKCIIIEYIFF